MNSPFHHYVQPPIFRSAVLASFRHGPLVILSESILYVLLHEPYYRENFSRPEAWHWLGLVSVTAVVLTGLLFAITVGVFACHPDWHTFDGCVALLRWLFLEAVLIVGLAGLARRYGVASGVTNP